MSISFIYYISFIIVFVYCLKKEDVYMSISFIYIIYHRLSIAWTKGCKHDYILYISYIIYNRMFLYCLERKKGGGGEERMYTWVYDTYLIYHLSSFVCTLLENVYMSIYFIYHNSIIHHRLSVYCLERERKKSVYMSKSLILYIIFYFLSVAWRKRIYGSFSWKLDQRGCLFPMK